MSEIVLGVFGYIFLAAFAFAIIGLAGVVFVGIVKWIWEVIHFDD